MMSDQDLLSCTARIVSSWTSVNAASPDDLTTAIREVHGTLQRLISGEAPAELSPMPQRPAVPIKRSVQPDHIVCLEDGKKLKMLKRYLRTAYDMSPDEYRAKWGLPSDYPMIAPSYAAERSALAKKIGLGRTGRQTTKTTDQNASAAPKRSRRKTSTA